MLPHQTTIPQWNYKYSTARITGPVLISLGFPDGSDDKESTCNIGDLGSIPGLGRSPGEGKGYPLQYSGLENSMDCMVHGVAESQTRLRDFHLLYFLAENSGQVQDTDSSYWLYIPLMLHSQAHSPLRSGSGCCGGASSEPSNLSRKTTFVQLFQAKSQYRILLDKRDIFFN